MGEGLGTKHQLQPRLCHNRHMDSRERTEWIVRHAKAIGFDLCGVAVIPADTEDASWPELAHFPEWLARGYAGEMRYLENPRRASPQQAMTGARSVIVCALNYNTAQPHSTEIPLGGRSFSSDTNDRKNKPASAAEDRSGDSPRGWISRYAWGTDYHLLLGEKLEVLIAAMREQFHDTFDAKWYVDTGPIHERAAAQQAGLGWLAKNTLLIHPEHGSWMFLGVILTTLELAPSLGPADLPQPDLCGQCTLCIDACPTEAFVEPYVLDARRCISYLTIELRGAIPEELREPMGRHVFGCDICQDVCPWNLRAPVTSDSAFEPHERLFAPELEWLASLGEEDFRRIFRDSPVKRTKWRGLIRNLCVALGNSGLQRGTPAYSRVTSHLARLAAGHDALIAEHAKWALGRLNSAPADPIRLGKET
jgi:epoxyqueuosine reductase